MSLPLSPSQFNKRIEFLNRISTFDVLLFKPGIEDMFSNDVNRQKFNDLRFAWHKSVANEKISLAEVLINELESTEADFKAGISSLEAKIQQINDEVAFLQLLDKTLKTLLKVVVMLP